MLAIAVFFYGLFGECYNPVTQIVTTELPGATPEAASAAFSIVFAAGYLGTIFAPLIMTAATEFISMHAAMYLYVVVYVLVCITTLLIRETGTRWTPSAPNAKQRCHAGVR